MKTMRKKFLAAACALAACCIAVLGAASLAYAADEPAAPTGFYQWNLVYDFTYSDCDPPRELHSNQMLVSLQKTIRVEGEAGTAGKFAPPAISGYAITNMDSRGNPIDYSFTFKPDGTQNYLATSAAIYLPDPIIVPVAADPVLGRETLCPRSHFNISIDPGEGTFPDNSVTKVYIHRDQNLDALQNLISAPVAPAGKAFRGWVTHIPGKPELEGLPSGVLPSFRGGAEPYEEWDDPSDYPWTITAAFDTVVDGVEAVEGLVYNGSVQAGVEPGVGYTVTGGTALHAGTYTATATLEPGYVWPDGKKDPKTITYSIAPKHLTITPASGQFKVEGEADPVFAYTADGFVGNGALDLGGALGRIEGEAPGAYAFTLGTLKINDGREAGNYELVLAADAPEFEIKTAEPGAGGSGGQSGGSAKQLPGGSSKRMPQAGDAPYAAAGLAALALSSLALVAAKRHRGRCADLASKQTSA